jgi:hypothetical protein
MGAMDRFDGASLRAVELEYPLLAESREEMAKIAFLLNTRDEIAIDCFPERARRLRNRRAEQV